MPAIRLPEEIESRSSELAAGRDAAGHRMRARRFLSILTISNLYLAQEQMAEVRAGRVKTVPLEEVMSRYGLEG